MMTVTVTVTTRITVTVTVGHDNSLVTLRVTVPCHGHGFHVTTWTNSVDLLYFIIPNTPRTQWTQLQLFYLNYFYGNFCVLFYKKIQTKKLQLGQTVSLPPNTRFRIKNKLFQTLPILTKIFV